MKHEVIFSLSFVDSSQTVRTAWFSQQTTDGV